MEIQGNSKTKNTRLRSTDRDIIRELISLEPIIINSYMEIQQIDKTKDTNY